MYFKDVIPSKLQEYPNVSQFMDVLEALQNFKQGIIAESFRANNASILMNSKWLLKKLEEFGISDMPLDYPIQPMRQLLLNIDTVCGTRGSQIGIILYCSVLSLGEVFLDDENFYTGPATLLLDSLTQGYITQDRSKPPFYLVSDSYTNPEATLKIKIKSKYFNGDYPKESYLIKNYIKSTIDRQLGFSPNKNVLIDYERRDDFYFHKLLNPYFV